MFACLRAYDKTRQGIKEVIEMGNQDAVGGGGEWNTWCLKNKNTVSDGLGQNTVSANSKSTMGCCFWAIERARLA